MLLVQTHPVKELVIIYVEGGGGQGYFRLDIGGEAKLFYKEV